MINKNNLLFVIYTPIYDENIGGIIVLHKLCATLNTMGIKAKLWHSINPVKICSFKTFRKKIRYKIKSFFSPKKLRSPYHLDIAIQKELENAIVIYPEIIDGNPLQAQNIVRWLLYIPGAHTGKINYGHDELFFFYNPQFINEDFKFNVSGQLTITENMKDIYRQTNFGQRKGTCFMIRKGNKRKLDYHPENALQVDGLSHQELSRIFNEYEYFISYDLYTMYSSYAAICGCKSIVVPEEGKTVEEIKQEQKTRPGVAYGRENIDYALSTRNQLLQDRILIEYKEEQSVKDFVDKCYEYFFNTPLKNQ